jgi:hypothetical protein
MSLCGIDNKVGRLSSHKKPYYQEHAGIQDGDGKEENKISAEMSTLPVNFFKRDKIAEMKEKARKHKDDVSQHR